MNKLIALSLVSLASVVTLAYGFYQTPYGGGAMSSFGFGGSGGFMEFFFMSKYPL